MAIAITGSADIPLVALGLAIAAWTGGFDVLYSLQDYMFDQTSGLHSVPARFGVKKSLMISRISFLTMALLLVVVGELAAMGPIYFSGVAIISGILIYEHYLIGDVGPTGKSSKMNAAFFTANAWISVIFFLFALADRIWS